MSAVGVPSTGPVRLKADIGAAFNGGKEPKLRNFLGVASGVPASGVLKFSDLRGKAPITVVNHYNLDSRTLALANGARVTTWNDFSAYNALESQKPIFYTSGGLNNGPYVMLPAVSYDKALKKNANSKVNIKTNGGFTAAYVFRVPSGYDNPFLVNMDNGDVLLYVYQGKQQIWFVDPNGTNRIYTESTYIFNSNVWNRVIFRFNNATAYWTILLNQGAGPVASGFGTPFASDPTVSICNLYNQNYTISASADVMYVKTWDTYLDDSEIPAVWSNMP